MENQINQIIEQRRSIYPHEYTGEQIDAAVIETLLRNANFAPNHKSNYPWRFVVMSNNGLSQWLKTATDIYQSETTPETFKAAKLEKILAYQGQVSHAIAIVMERNPERHSIEREDLCAVAAGVQNMYLSLSQFPHVGGYWSTGLGTYSARMHQFLELNEQQTLLGFFILGAVAEKRTQAHKLDYHTFVKHRS